MANVTQTKQFKDYDMIKKENEKKAETAPVTDSWGKVLKPKEEQKDDGKIRDTRG